MLFTAFYYNGRDRIEQRDVEAADIDQAAKRAIDEIESAFGASATWFLIGIVQADLDYLLASQFDADGLLVA